MNKAIALLPPPHLMMGPQPNHQNPLLVRLVDIYHYFTLDKTTPDNDWYQRKGHFRELLVAISSGDIQKSIEVLERGKSEFGAWRVMSVKPNLWRSERYYDLLVKLYDAQVLKEANIKTMNRDVKDSELEKYIKDEDWWCSEKVFGIENKYHSSYSFGRKNKKPEPETLSHSDALYLTDQFLRYYGIPDDYVPPPALPPAPAVIGAAAPGQLVPVNVELLPPMSDAAFRKIQGMSDAEREMFQLTLDTRRNEIERQRVISRWEELRQRYQPGNRAASPEPARRQDADPFCITDQINAVWGDNTPSPQSQFSNASPFHYDPVEPTYFQSANPNGFLAPPVAPYPQPVVHLQPTMYPPDSGIQWSPVNF